MKTRNAHHARRARARRRPGAGSVAWATIPADTSLYTACKLKATGTIRLIDPSGPSGSLLSRCTSLETQITGARTGRRATPGRPEHGGSDGVDGKDGLPGANGMAGVKGGPDAAVGQPSRRQPRAIGARRVSPASRASRARPARRGPPGTPGGGAASPHES